ncbi:MAG: NarK family nitrate/nitrite MFS transporter [Rickettsiales bacterium]
MNATTKAALANWNPEDQHFWQNMGRFIARRNLWISVPCLLLSFSTWMIWSAVAVNLNSIGFDFTKEQLFTLAAVPGLTGATLRIIYSFVVPIFGGKNWTVISTALLLIPCIGIGQAIQDTNTSYETMLILAALCGFGGGNFSSSMANISYFFPKNKQGLALGINAGLGNLGVSVLQFTVPVIIGMSVFGDMGGAAQMVTSATGETKQVWLQNASYIWVLPIILCTLAAAFGMHNLPTAKSNLAEQLVIFKRKHMYLTTWLYVMSFGSFIGYSAAFPLLIKTQFTDINPLQYAFLGPFLGAIIRPIGGWISDKVGGANITFWNLLVMIGAVLGVIHFIQPESKEFFGFFACFMLLFTTTGIANGSVFRMIGVIFPPKEKAPALGFSSAIAAFGAFYIPKCFGWSIAETGAVDAALYGFIVYYISCLFVTYYWYFRKNAEIKC